MSLFTKLGNEIASPVDAAGNPRAVENADMQRWMTEVERATLAFQAGGGIIFPNKATMEDSLTYAANQMAWVMGDATAGNNGIYRKVGASGSGSWVRLGDLPFSFIMATNAGAGTPDAIVATSLLPIPAADGAAMISLNVAVGNTGSPVTVSFNGGAPLTIKTMSGNDVAPGGLTAGMIVTGFKAGSTFRMITDQASAAIQAAAEAAQAAAEAAQAAAEGAAAGVHLPVIGAGDAGKSLVVKQGEDGYELLDERGVVRVANRTALKALDGTRTPVAFIYNEGGRNGTFVWNPGNFSVGVAADPAEAIYVPPASDPTGASGAWVRQNPMVGVPNFGATRRMVHLSWFGMSATASAADNTAAFNAFMAFAGGAAGAIGILPAGVLQVNTLLINASNTLVEGHKDGTWLVNNTTNAPAVRIQPETGTAFFSGIGRVTIAQAAGVAPVTGNCGVRVQNTFHASVYDIVCTQYPAALHRGFIFDNADESLIENLIATNCLGDGFYFGNGCSGASGHTLKAFSNGGAGLMFDGVSGFWVNSVHAFGNGTFGILFNHTSGRVNQFFFCSGWIADTSGQSNWQIANLNRSSFSNSWAATQKNTVDFPGACGILITSANVFDVDLIGMQVLNNNSHGLLIGGGADNIRIHGGTYGANPTTGHGNGRAGSGSGIRIALATDITITGTRCRGNASDGLITEAVASDYLIITNNNLRGNGGTSLNDNSTGTNNVLANNIV